MDSNKIEKLRIAANQFYLNKYKELPTLSDAEYDSLADEYAAEGGSVYDLVDWDVDMRRPNKPLPKVNKEQVGDNDLNSAIERYIEKNNITKFRKDYKYDGSSIIAYYTPEGYLHHILGTPDCELCVDRTRNCINMFPHRVTPGIECIQGEFLVDADVYGQKARNKANGLLNSKDMIDDIEKEGFIRVYQMRFYDGNWSFNRLFNELDALPVMAKDRIRPVRDENGEIIQGISFDAYFARAEYVDHFEDSIITEDSIEIDEGLLSDPVKFQVDGAVLYFDGEEGYHAFKFYYTESAITTVTQIAWNKAGSGSWQPKLNFEGVVLNDKNIWQAASGGYPNLQAMQMGKGAKIRVILSNMTIPKVIEVIEPSEDYQLPTCGCGHQLNPATDCYGSGLKCTELDCSERYNDRVETFKWWIPMRWADNPDWSFDDLLREDIWGVLNVALNIDRWDSKSRVLDKENTSAVLYSELKDLMTAEHSPIDFKYWVQKNFYLPGLCQSILDINYLTADRILKKLFNISDDELMSIINQNNDSRN